MSTFMKLAIVAAAALFFAVPVVSAMRCQQVCWKNKEEVGLVVDAGAAQQAVADGLRKRLAASEARITRLDEVVGGLVLARVRMLVDALPAGTYKIELYCPTPTYTRACRTVEAFRENPSSGWGLAK